MNKRKLYSVATERKIVLKQ